MPATLTLPENCWMASLGWARGSPPGTSLTGLSRRSFNPEESNAALCTCVTVGVVGYGWQPLSGTQLAHQPCVRRHRLSHAQSGLRGCPLNQDQRRGFDSCPGTKAASQWAEGAATTLPHQCWHTE